MIEKIIVISLLVFAIHYTMEHGEIFGFLGDWFSDHLPDKLHNPVFACSVCMAPWYGTIIYWLVWRNGLKEWLIVIISAMGLNAVISQLTAKE